MCTLPLFGTIFETAIRQIIYTFDNEKQLFKKIVI